jgi:DNA-binding transcriptional LysR family regulator
MLLRRASGPLCFIEWAGAIELTEAGRVFLPEAKIVLAKVSGAEQVLAELDGLLRGRLAPVGQPDHRQLLAATFSLSVPCRPPECDVELHVGNSLQVSRAVLDGAADLARLCRGRNR